MGDDNPMAAALRKLMAIDHYYAEQFPVTPDPEAIRVLEQAKTNRNFASQVTVADAYFLKGLGIKP